MIEIVSEIESSRLKYTLDLIFNQLLGIEYKVVKEFISSELPAIHYSEQSNSTPGIYIPKIF